MSVSQIDRFIGDVYRHSVYVEKLKLAFSQFIVRSPTGETWCISAGMRADFPQLKSNLHEAGLPVEQISSLVVPHFEADEMGALPDFIAHNSRLVAYAHPICAHALSDIFAVKTRILKDREPVTISGEEVIPIHVTHVHQWDSVVVYVPRLKALFSSDIFMSYGPVHGSGSILDNVVKSIEKSGYLPSLDHLAVALKKLQQYEIDWIFPMHGPAVSENIPDAISALIDYCEKQQLKTREPVA
jgi:flavorubredoxin